MKTPVEGGRGRHLQAGGPQRRFMDGERRMQRSGLAGDSRRGDQCGGGGRGGRRNVCPLT